MSKTLKDLKPKQRGIISDVKGPAKRRFMDMGLVKGTEIVVEKIAPLGDPMEIKIKGYNLTLRREDAESIGIE